MVRYASKYRDGAISFAKDDDPELIIYFRDIEDARGLISGKRDPVSAFMHGNLRANGHLIWVFQTMAALSGKTMQLQPSPVDLKTLGLASLK